MSNDKKFTPLAEEANKGHIHLVKHCLDLFDKFSTSKYRERKRQEIEESVKAYEQEERKTANMWDGESKITLPLTTISCDNLEPRLVAGLVGKKPFIYFEPENGQKQDEPTEILESWFNNELEDVVKAESVASDIIHQLMQEGTVFILPSYDLDETTVKDFVFEEDVLAPVQQVMQQNPNNPIAAQQAQQMMMQIQAALAEQGQQFIGGILMGPDGPVTQDVKTTVFEGGKIDIVPWEDVYIPDDADEWEKAPVIRQIKPTYAELYNDSKTKPGYIRKNIGPWLCDEATDTIPDDSLTAAQELDEIEQNGKKVIPCLECYLSYLYRKDDLVDEKDASNWTEERLVATLTKDSGILLRLLPLRELNYKNEHLIKRIRLFPRRGKSYGTSIYAKMKSIQDGASKTFNMAINTAEVSLIPWFFYEERTGLKKNRASDGKPGMELVPGMGVQVDTVEGILFPTFSINPDHYFNWINLWVSFWERLLSIGDLQVGRQGEKDRTATETMAVLQEGNVKHNYQAQSIKEEFLTVLRTLYDLYYQRMPYDKTFLWNGQQVPIPRSLMRRPKKFRLTGSTDQSNKLIERAEKEQFYQLTAADPNINPVKRAQELVKAYGHTDESEWVSPQIAQIVQAITQIPNAMPLVQQALQQAQTMAQQMQAQAQGGQNGMSQGQR